MLTEQHRQYQALECTFLLDAQGVGSWDKQNLQKAKFAESKIFLIPLSQIGGKKNARASGIA
jgi:hypothetical protein